MEDAVRETEVEEEEVIFVSSTAMAPRPAIAQFATSTSTRDSLVIVLIKCSTSHQILIKINPRRSLVLAPRNYAQAPQ